MLAFRSLRVRLPLVFLAGIILAGAITALIAIRLFQDFARNQAYRKLTREAHGIAQIYATSINNGYGNQTDRRAPTQTVRRLCDARGVTRLPVIAWTWDDLGYMGRLRWRSTVSSSMMATLSSIVPSPAIVNLEQTSQRRTLI